MGQLGEKELNAEIDRKTRELLALQQERARRRAQAVQTGLWAAYCFWVAVNADLSFRIKGQRYQLPRSAMVDGRPNPFLLAAKVRIIWPTNADYYVAIVDNFYYEIAKAASQPH